MYFIVIHTTTGRKCFWRYLIRMSSSIRNTVLATALATIVILFTIFQNLSKPVLTNTLSLSVNLHNETNSGKHTLISYDDSLYQVGLGFIDNYNTYVRNDSDKLYLYFKRKGSDFLSENTTN